MRKSLFILFILCLFPAFALAQEGTIIDELNTSRWGQGKVKVMQDETIENTVAVRNKNKTDSLTALGIIDPTAEHKKVRGFKIQVFSGNNQQTSKREAESKQAQIRSAFPDLESIVSFQSPFWRLRVGNFLKKEDAEEVLKEMKIAFPGYGREMYVVSDVVKRPVEY